MEMMRARPMNPYRGIETQARCYHGAMALFCARPMNPYRGIETRYFLPITRSISTRAPHESLQRD